MAPKSALTSVTSSEISDLTLVEEKVARVDEIYSEGPVRAWCTVIGACLVQICAIGILSSYGVFQEFYVREWLPNSSSSAISWIGSTQIFLEYALSPIGGELLDRGYFHSMVTAGCSLFLFSFFMLSFTQAHQYYQVFLAQAIGMGIGVGILFLPTSVVVIRHFKKNQALAIGIVDSTISLGGLIFSIVLNYLIHGRLGFKWGIRVVALITLICFAIGIPMMSMPKRAGKDAAPVARSTWKGVAAAARRDWAYLLVLAQGFIMCLGTFVPSFYLQLYAVTHGTSKEVSFYALSVLNFAGVFGRIIPNHLGDRYGVLNVYIPCLMATGGLCFAMLGAGQPSGLFPFAIFYGFFFGATNGMYLPIINSLSTGSADHLWKRCGISLIPPAIASLIGSPIAGSILGPQYHWWRGILFASLTILVATCLALGAKIAHDKNLRVEKNSVDSEKKVDT